ncbi:MAG: hypothetical protein ACFCVA_17855 [Gammaproteobacteria bacterium]
MSHHAQRTCFSKSEQFKVGVGHRFGSLITFAVGPADALVQGTL